MRSPDRALSGRHAGWRRLRAAGFGAARIDDVLAFYDAPHRVYHDRRHLQQMLDDAERLPLSLSAAQALAVLFHDAVYVPGAASGANETLSAQMLRVYAQGLPAAIVEEAAAIVLDTVEHLPRSPAAEAVLDLDLLRLAAPAEEFERHSRDVFMELRPLYPPGDDRSAWETFVRRRAQFFERLLARPGIYATGVCRRRFEAQGRANLRAALSGSDSRETP